MSRTRTVATALLLGLFSLIPGAAFSQGAPIGAEIRNGTCDQPSDPIFTLQPPQTAAGDHVGDDHSTQAASSFTPSVDTMDDLLGSPAVVTLSSGNTIVACGSIGGVFEADGALGIVLRPTMSGGPDGVAYFRSTGDVSLFVDPGDAAARMAAPAQAAPPSSEQSPAQPGAAAPSSSAAGIVANPPSSDTAPAVAVSNPGNGATAQCNDGTYSYAATHQGACSRHGGVAIFYK